MSEDFPFEEFQVSKKFRQRFKYWHEAIGSGVQVSIIMAIAEFMIKQKLSISDHEFQEVCKTVNAYLEVEGHMTK